ncbi:MAG: hypothetical protein ACXVGN_00030 [Mycobacteriaceae bacterium]
MEDDNSLGGAIQAAVFNWLSENGGGFPTAYVMAVDYVGDDGECRLLVCEMEGQKSRHSLGLVAELEELYRLESREGWAMTHYAADEEE